MATKMNSPSKSVRRERSNFFDASGGHGPNDWFKERTRIRSESWSGPRPLGPLLGVGGTRSKIGPRHGQSKEATLRTAALEFERAAQVRRQLFADGESEAAAAALG